MRGPGGLWFTEHGHRLEIGNIGTNGTVVEYPVPLVPWDLGMGPDGAIWYTEWPNDEVNMPATRLPV